MGAWGHGPFDNDDAMGFLGDFLAEGEVDFLREALELVAEAEPEEWVEVDSAAAAVAAAEIVAAIQGQPMKLLPDGLATWLADSAKPPVADLLPDARAAVDRVRTASELAELWAASDSVAWAKSINDLRRRLG
jgi:uncharacterized protein DUF4259